LAEKKYPAEGAQKSSKLLNNDVSRKIKRTTLVYD